MSSSALPLLDSRQVKELDALAEERFGILVEWLMEAAGWAAARFCTEPAVVVCGVGNNAGDGLAAARHLHRWGRLAGVCCIDAERMRGPAALELDALQRLGIEIWTEPRLSDAGLVLDAIFGIGLTSKPEGPFADWIEAINGSGKRVVALDVPSGLDADSGLAYSPTVRADLTVTLGSPKRGLVEGDGPRVAGEVWVADIGIPDQAYAMLGIAAPGAAFGANGVVRL